MPRKAVFDFVTIEVNPDRWNELRMEVEECTAGTWVYTWPRWNNIGGPTPAEQLARTLAAIDTSFEVRGRET